MLKLKEITKENLSKKYSAIIYRWRFVDYIDSFKSKIVPSFEEHTTFLEKEVESASVSWFMMISEEEIVGVMSVIENQYNSKESSYTFGRLMVAPNRRRQNLGRTLLEKGIEYIKNCKNGERVELEVLNTNYKAINLYNKFGFNVIREEEEVLFMEKLL